MSKPIPIPIPTPISHDRIQVKANSRAISKLQSQVAIIVSTLRDMQDELDALDETEEEDLL